MKKKNEITYYILIFGIVILIIIAFISLFQTAIIYKKNFQEATITETTTETTKVVIETTYIETTTEEQTELTKITHIEDYATKEEIEMIAKVLYREARGVKDKDQIAAVAWCILNRVDHPNHPNTIKEVIIQPEQFAWIEDTPVEDWLLELANDVVYRWCLEKEGQEDVGRTLPKGYCFFIGDGKYNHFRQNFNSKQIWDWSYPRQY